MTLFWIEKGEHHLTLNKLETLLNKLKIRLTIGSRGDAEAAGRGGHPRPAAGNQNSTWEFLDSLAHSFAMVHKIPPPAPSDLHPSILV